MRKFQIKSKLNQTILFEGLFNNFATCLETAITQQANLTHANLRNLNLCNANLDEAWLTHADFTGSNLTGANLSESRLLGCNFTNTALYNTCFAYSDLQHCHFEHAQFGGTDISGTNLSFSYFIGLSCFSLDFSSVEHMRNCRFTDLNGQPTITSTPPIVITGLHTRPIIFMNNVLEKDLHHLIA